MIRTLLERGIQLAKAPWPTVSLRPEHPFDGTRTFRILPTGHDPCEGSSGESS